MRRLLALSAALVLSFGLILGVEDEKKSTPKKTATSKKTTASKKTTTSRKTAGKKGRSSKSGKRSAQSWRSRQLAPTPERYKEIQTALVEKGYLKAPANGVWDQASVDALRRFQQEQHLEPSGKLNSLSLIALGLGPKRDSIAAVPPPPRPSPPQP